MILRDIETTVNKPPLERTDAEIERILPWFKKKSDLFQSIKKGNNWVHLPISHTFHLII